MPSPRSGSERCARREEHIATPCVPGIDARLHEALIDLHTYILVLDAERQRLQEQLATLGAAEADVPLRADLERQRAAMDEDLGTLHAMLVALRSDADPTGSWL
jgi:hypothetical protein